MSGYRHFMTLVKKEAKTLWGVAAALAVLVVGKAAVQLYFYQRYPEAFSSIYRIPLNIPLYRGFIVASTGITYTIQTLLPIVLVLYLFIGERLSRSHVQLHALPTRRAWWLTAKVIVPAAILGTLYTLSFLLDGALVLVQDTIRLVTVSPLSENPVPIRNGTDPFLPDLLALISRGGGVYFLLNIVLQSTVLLTVVTFLSYAAALAVRRHRTVVWIVVMVTVMVCVPLLDARIRSMFSGYIGQSRTMVYRPYGWYLIGYPLAWIALTLGAGLFIHEKYGEA